MASLEAWLMLRAIKGLSDRTLAKLARHFGSPESVSNASIQELRDAGGISTVLAQAIQKGPDEQSRAIVKKEAETIRKQGLSVVTLLDSIYPSRLAMIPDPPPVLYVNGTFSPSDDHAVAMVGSRKATHAGVLLTEELSQNLAALGFTIVSGLARGIDAAAHRGALKAGGRTIAVMGCGIDRTYPPEHGKLRQAIEAQGAVVSEFPLGTAPRPYNFPRRNRIISGLSLGVVVAEASRQSGSLITARLALEQDREVFAIPGSVRDGKHQGPHGLIKQGAKLVEDMQDIVEELLPQLDDSFQDQVKNARPVPEVSTPTLGSQEQDVYRFITEEPLSIDEILAQAPFLPAEVMSILLALELKGVIRQVPGGCYLRV